MEKQIRHLFEELVTTDSPSGEEGKIKEKVMSFLEKQGFSPEETSGNLIARRGDGEPLLLCCHMDTVESNAQLDLGLTDGEFFSRGKTILGADDKAGLAVLLTCLAEVPDSAPIEVLLTVKEELGMLGAQALSSEQLQAQMGLVLDAGEPVGTIINRAPGESELVITISGKSAHAAVEPEAGIDALRLAARFIEQLPPHRLDSDTSFNIGIIRGGRATNSICDHIELTGEIRSFIEQRRQEFAKQLKTLLEKSVTNHGGRFELTCKNRYSGYEVSMGHKLLSILEAAASGTSVSVQTHARNAGSDANILNQLGIVTVNLGTGYSDGHSSAERVALAEMTKLAQWLVKIIQRWSDVRS